MVLKLTAKYVEMIRSSQITVKKKSIVDFLRPFRHVRVSFKTTLRRRSLKEVQAWEPQRKLGVIMPPCELELTFQTPNGLKIPNLKLKLKVKINAQGKNKLEPKQDNACDNFLLIMRLHTRPSSWSTGVWLMAPSDWSYIGCSVLKEKINSIDLNVRVA